MLQLSLESYNTACYKFTALIIQYL